MRTDADYAAYIEEEELRAGLRERVKTVEVVKTLERTRIVTAIEASVDCGIYGMGDQWR